MLFNGLCEATSGDMGVKTESCRDCEEVRVEVKNVIKYTDDELCLDSLLLSFYNYTAITVTASMTTVHGIIIGGAGISLPAGYTTGTFRYIADAGFMGATDTLILTVTLPNGSVCISKVAFHIIPCANSAAKGLNSPTDGRKAAIKNQTGAALRLSPNPANGNVRINYRLAEEVEVAGQGMVELYTTSGMLLECRKVNEAAGTWQLSLSEYPAGLYLVLLRQGGRLLMQHKLSVIK